MKTVILVTLPKIETTFPPGAIAVLSSVAKNNQRHVNVFDYNLDLLDALNDTEWNLLESWCSFSVDTLPLSLEKKLQTVFSQKLDQLLNDNVELVAFSVFSYFSNRVAVKVLSWFRELSNLPIVVGGSGVSTDTSANNKEIFGNHLQQLQLADYVIFGEGEKSFDHLLKGQFNYPGINKNNPVQIEDLTLVPLPTYEFFDMSRYQNKKILVTGSRGCVRKCTFCDIELTWPKFRYRKAEHILDEIKQHFYQYGITEFEFTDSLINGSISNFDRFNELLYEAKQKYPELEPIRYQGQFICRPQSTQS